MEEWREISNVRKRFRRSERRDGCWRVPEEEPRRSIMSVDRANLIDNLIELMKIAGSASRVTREFNSSLAQ